MRSILVLDRKHLFPGLSPQGFLPEVSIDLEAIHPHLFFAERDFMERNSHFKQIIPYLVLQRGRGAQARVLAYQRRGDHSESRLGGLWSVGFGGHIEPLDRDRGEAAVHGLVLAGALRELDEETGLSVASEALRPAGFINSDREDVSSVHFGVVFRVDLDARPEDDEALVALVSAQAEPHRALWLPVGDLVGMTGPGAAPDGGSFEDWSRIAIEGIFGSGA